MYCWHLLLLALLCHTPPSISERFNGRHCCDQPPDTRLLSYRRLLDKPSVVQEFIRGPDIRSSRWKDERDIEAYRRTSEEKSGERYERNILERRTERDAGFNRFDTREKRVRKDARNTLQRNIQRRETSRRFDSRNGQMQRMERNPNAFDRKIERQTTRENTERRQTRPRFETRQVNRNEVSSREFEHIDDQRRIPTKRINNIRVSNLPIREIRAVRRFDDNRASSQSVERMARQSRMPRLATDRRDTRFVLDRRSPLDSVASTRFSHFPTLTRNRLSVSNVKDDNEREIRRTGYRGIRSDRHLSSLLTNIRTSILQRDSRRISERDTLRASMESTRRSENLSSLTRELRRIDLDENRRITRSIPQNDRQIYDNERRILRTPTRQIETERSYAKQEYRPSQERDNIRNDGIRREYRISTERQSTLRIDERSSRTSSELIGTRRIKFERYDSERRNIPSEANSRRDSGVIRQLSRFSTERRVSAFKRANRQYSTERQSSRLSERLDIRSRDVSRTATNDNEGRFNVNNRHSRAVSETRRSVERKSDLQRELKRSQMSRDTTDRENRRYTTDNRLVRDESDGRLSNVLNRQRENRKLSSSMDRVDMRYIRERQETRARINERHIMEPRIRFVIERPETRRNQDQRFGVVIRQSRSLSDLEARASRRNDNTARFSNLQQIHMFRESQDVRRNNERNMESRVRREKTQVRRSLHRDVTYTPRIESARRNSERNSDARSLLQNARRETELSRNLNTERMNVRRYIDELSQITSERTGYDRTVRDSSRYERHNVKSRLTTFSTERYGNRRNDERRFRHDENRISDSRRSEDMRRENRMSHVSDRETILRKLSEHITTRTDNTRNIDRLSERDIRERRIEERVHNQDSIARKISERVESTENLQNLRQNSRTILQDGRGLSRFVRFDRRKIDTQSINRQVRSYRMDTDSRSKLERRENRILTLERNDKRNAMDDDQRDGGSVVLNWQYLFYVIQGVYLCSVLLHSNDPKSKIKSRNFGWWNPMYRLKLD